MYLNKEIFLGPYLLMLKKQIITQEEYNKIEKCFVPNGCIAFSAIVLKNTIENMNRDQVKRDIEENIVKRKLIRNIV